jgi:dihydropteroate synthase
MNFWQCGQSRLPLGERTLLMAIVNATPDSFSGDGTLSGASTCDKAQVLERSLQHALRQWEAGADILDIGGESTRPGAIPVSQEEEIARVVPLVAALRAASTSGVSRRLVLSVDTTKSEVARAALEAGADIINDISGATFDPAMLPTLAASDCGVVLMHLRGAPQQMKWSQAQNTDSNADVIEEVLAFWRARVDAAREAGIADERICLDAGFGFGKSVEENLALLRRGRELRVGFPTLSGTSRKSTVGKVVGRALNHPRGEVPVSERAWGTAATVAAAILNGADIVRVHDVREMAHVAAVADAIVGGGAEAST